MHVGIATGFANHTKVDDAQFIREEFTQLELADELGFDSIWMTEHHFSDYSISPNPLFYLAYLAGRTRRARLGTQVVVAPWHDPVRLAEEISMLDHMSGGRAIIGNAEVNVAIEAAVRWGWDAVIGKDGEFIGMHGFGASAPAKDLFKHFGITAEAAVNAALKRLG